MIEMYAGRIGGGKSYNAVERAAKYLASGGIVCTNIRLVWDKVVEYCRLYYGVEPERAQYIYLEDEQIRLFHLHTPNGTPEKPSLVIIDEAHIWFNNRDFASQDRAMLTFLTQSRKCFTDIIWISQSELNCDKQFIRLVQFTWRFRDLSQWKIPVLRIRCPINVFLSVQYDQDGRTQCGRNWVTKNKHVFAMYETFQLARGFPRLERPALTGVTRYTGAGSRRRVAYGVCAFVVLCGCAWWWSGVRANASIGEEVPGASSLAPLDAPVETASVAAVVFDVTASEFSGKRIEAIWLNGKRIIREQLCELGKFVDGNGRVFVFDTGTNLAYYGMKSEYEDANKSFY